MPPSVGSAVLRTLRGVREEEYVRFLADWLTRAVDLDDAPALTGNRTIDALTAAAAAHCAMTRRCAIPAWTNEPCRFRSLVASVDTGELCVRHFSAEIGERVFRYSWRIREKYGLCTSTESSDSRPLTLRTISMVVT